MWRSCMQSRSLSGRVLDSGNVPTLRREKCSRFGRRRTSSQQSSDSIRISVKTRLRRVLRSMREMGWRETGSRLGLPRRASGPAASRVGPARTLTVVEPMGSLGDSGASVRGRTGFSHGCKISAPSVRDTLRPYRDRDPRPTPRRHVGLRTRARSLAARDGAPRPRRRRRATCSSHVWSLDVVVCSGDCAAAPRARASALLAPDACAASTLQPPRCTDLRLASPRSRLPWSVPAPRAAGAGRPRPRTRGAAAGAGRWPVRSRSRTRLSGRAGRGGRGGRDAATAPRL